MAYVYEKCEQCDLSEQERRDGDPWRAAMIFAHHAHEEKTYYGHMSANGVLGAGPDAVIVDGDWLHDLEHRANHPAVKIAVWSDQILLRTKTAFKYFFLIFIPGLACLWRGHKTRSPSIFFDTDYCTRCFKNVVVSSSHE